MRSDYKPKPPMRRNYGEIIWQVGLAVLGAIVVFILFIDPRELTGEPIPPPPDFYQGP